MTNVLKITSDLYAIMRQDLIRPHSYAAERVGFMFCRFAQAGGESTLVLASSYTPVADALYIRDRKVGARINGEAIRLAMQEVMDTGCGCFHVHLHGHKGIPGLSFTDRREIPPIIDSLAVVGPESYHGIFLLSDDKCFALVRSPRVSQLFPASKISIVGYPLDTIRED